MGRIGRALSIAAVTITAVTACSTSATGGRGSHRPAGPSPEPTRTSTSGAAGTPSATAASSTAPRSRHRSRTPPRPSASPSSAPTRRAPATGRRLPLPFTTGDARQVITAVGDSTSSTRGTLQAWDKVAGGWVRVGPAVPAWFGTAGLAVHPSESTSGTPVGSFTLTQAFGHDSDPGTALPYTRTNPDDWWISQPGPLYNTRQRCARNCPFTLGAPNEHLYYEMPYYAHAIVIDYNTGNAPGGVRQGAGSAFFLHVAVGEPTAGCVSIEREQLVRLLRWLRPASAPRILIGTK